MGRDLERPHLHEVRGVAEIEHVDAGHLKGDARDYSGFSELARAGGLSLDPAAFPSAAELRS